MKFEFNPFWEEENIDYDDLATYVDYNFLEKRRW